MGKNDQPTGPPALDAGVIDKLIDDLGPDGPADVIELMGLYLRESEGSLATLRAAIARADLPTAGSTAHEMQSSTALLGASTLARLLRETIKAARRDGNGLAELSSLVEAEYGRVTAAMTAILPELRVRAGPGPVLR